MFRLDCAGVALKSVTDVDSGLGGRLLTRGEGFGGAGKLPILDEARKVLPGVGIAEEEVGRVKVGRLAMPVVVNVGMEGVD